MCLQHVKRNINLHAWNSHLDYLSTSNFSHYLQKTCIQSIHTKQNFVQLFFPNSTAVWTGYIGPCILCVWKGVRGGHGVYLPVYPATDYAVIFPMLCFSLKTTTTATKHINSLQAIYNTLLRNPAACLLQH